MRVAIDPIVDIVTLDKILQFHGEGSIRLTIGKLGVLHLEGWHMMRDHNLLSGCAGFDGLLHEGKTTVVFPIEIGKGQQFLVIQNPSEIADDLFGIVGFFQRNFCPQSRNDDVGITMRDNSVVVTMHIVADGETVTIGQGGYVVELVELMVAHTHNYIVIVVRCPVPKRMLGVVMAESPKKL